MKEYNPASSQQTRVMTPQQFDEVVEAILDGKYSWACVLILRCANYNPLHYIPYRTYKRLIKDNQNLDCSLTQQKFKINNSCNQQRVKVGR